jgi:cation-transporting ATPase E
VAQIVLLDGKFARMPGVVAEGRRVIANIERVANLFVTKTFYATLLAVAVGVARWEYPFLPRQLTIISSLTIGIPAFFLALEPDVRRYVPGFVRRVLQQAGPAGAVAATATFTSYAIARYAMPPLDIDQERTAATLTLLIIGLWVLNLHARPITPLRGTLFLAMVGMFVIVLAVPGLREFFALELPRAAVTASAVACAAVAVVLLELGWTLLQARRPADERVRRIALRNPAAVAARAAG